MEWRDGERGRSDRGVVVGERCGGGGGGGADEILRRCLCRYQLKSRSYSTGALDDQQLLAIEGSKKVAARRALDVQVDGVRKRPVKRAKNPFPTATAIKWELDEPPDFLDDLQLWDLGCLRHDLRLWSLHD